MKLRLAPRALAEAKRKKTWWRKNRPAAPDLFEDELNVTLDAILATPALGTDYPSRFEVKVRRVLMPKTRNHVYFTVKDDELVILSVWGAQQARGPGL
jgi:plasmid stabilization system protein ParE